MSSKNIKLTIVSEKGDGELWGRMESPHEIEPGLLYTTVGSDAQEVTKKIKDLIADFISNEGQDSAFWKAIDAEAIEYEYQYDLTVLFESYPELNISEVADRAGINQSLMRQYKTGVKLPSEAQAKKIEEAIHSLGQDLLRVHLV